MKKTKTVNFSCFQGPDEEQQKVEPHHTVVFGDGDCVKFQNKVSSLEPTQTFSDKTPF